MDTFIGGLLCTIAAGLCFGSALQSIVTCEWSRSVKQLLMNVVFLGIAFSLVGPSEYVVLLYVLMAVAFVVTDWEAVQCVVLNAWAKVFPNSWLNDEVGSCQQIVRFNGGKPLRCLKRAKTLTRTCDSCMEALDAAHEDDNTPE